MAVVQARVALASQFYHRAKELNQKPGETERGEMLGRALALYPGHGAARAERARDLLGAVELSSAPKGVCRDALVAAERASLSWSSVDATARHGRILLWLSWTEGGPERFEAARLMWPDAPETLAQLAAAHYSIKDREQARLVATDLLERVPGSVDALYLLGAVAQSQDDHAKARAHYTHLLDRLSMGERAVAVNVNARFIDDYLAREAPDAATP